MKNVLVLGGSGFIGSHMIARLINEGCRVVSVDIKQPEFRDIFQNELFVQGDLRNVDVCHNAVLSYEYDTIHQYAADMGGSGYVFTGINDAEILHNSATINLNVLDAVSKLAVKPRIFYSSSACIYPEHNQLDPNNPNCEESSAYPASPDSDYGFEKLFSERLYQAYARNKGLNVRIARFHNIFGEKGTYDGGREKAPAALCRKVALAQDGTSIDIWGDGLQTRSFLHVNECIEGVLRLIDSDFQGPVNIGSEEMVTINQLAEMIIEISGKKLTLNHIKGPQGVRGRCSENTLLYSKLGWKPSEKLIVGLEKTYEWIERQVRAK